jgi:predicted dehydrogenase
LSEFEVVAVATSRQATADAAAERFGIPLAFGDADEMVRHPTVDVAVVAVRAPEHDRLVRSVLAAKKHLYCEWPLGASTGEARALAALAEQSGVRHIVGLQGYNTPRARLVAGLLADGVIGRLCAVSLVASGGSHGPTTKEALAYTLDPAGGVTLLSVATTHWLATLETMVGRLVSVSAEVLTVNRETLIAETGQRRPVSSPDQLVVAGVLESGALLGVVAHSGVSPGAYGYEARLVGTDGTILISPARTEPGRATSRASGIVPVHGVEAADREPGRDESGGDGAARARRAPRHDPARPCPKHRECLPGAGTRDTRAAPGATRLPYGSSIPRAR